MHDGYHAIDDLPEQAGLGVEKWALDPAYHFMLDHQLWLRIARLAPIRHIPKTWAAARQHPGAKNVNQAPGFGRETLHLLDWMQTQPDLAPILERDRRRIEAGAYRLNARYLLDGGQPGPALRSYGKALVRNPRFTLQHAHRMVFAALSLLGASGLADWYYRLRQNRRPDLSGLPGIRDWPGITLQ
ncbi:MAG TPA: hypothetical protein VF498_02715 [Anaerolineales bacterium]